jgi:hypothetical protein
MTTSSDECRLGPGDPKLVDPSDAEIEAWAASCPPQYPYVTQPGRVAMPWASITDHVPT